MIDKLYIPSSINTVAIPSYMIRHIDRGEFDEHMHWNASIIFRGYEPKLTKFECDHKALDDFGFQVRMIPIGEIKMQIIDDEKEVYINKYGKYRRGDFEGHLVFEKLKETCFFDGDGEVCEWKISETKEPEAYLTHLGHSLVSEDCYVNYTNIETENVFSFKHNNIACKFSSLSTLMLLLPTQKDATVKLTYIQVKRSPDSKKCGKPSEVTYKLSWNNGHPNIDILSIKHRDDILNHRSLTFKSTE